MAGAIAGTAILKGMSPTNRLRTITLTINNDCNLKCPHCYLQYNKKDITLSSLTLDSVFRSDFEHLAIVGKEPLLNLSSIQMVEDIVSRCEKSSRTVSLITNGVGLGRLPFKIANQLAYIDVSFDGGPESYSNYRSGSFEKVISGVQSIQRNSNVQINALHNINNLNLANVDDMMAVSEYANFKVIMFSPYLVTTNDGGNSVDSVGLKQIFQSLSLSSPFLENSKAILLLDLYHMMQEGFSEVQVKSLIAEYQLEHKVILIEKDPLLYGIIRVTYDDLVLSPYDSIHPSLYSKTSKHASGNDLNQLFSAMTAAYV